MMYCMFDSSDINQCTFVFSTYIRKSFCRHFGYMSSSRTRSSSTSESQSPTEVVSSSSSSSGSVVIQPGVAAQGIPTVRVPTPKELLQPKHLLRRPPYTSAARTRTHFEEQGLDRKYPLSKKLLPGGPVQTVEPPKVAPVVSFLELVPSEEPSSNSNIRAKAVPPPKSAARLDARAGVLVRPSSALRARPIPPPQGKAKGKGKK